MKQVLWACVIGKGGKYSRVARRLKVNNNHGHELEPCEVGEEVVQEIFEEEK